MFDHRRTHLTDAALLRTLASHAADERTATAVLLADLAEVDERRLYRGEGYPSLFSYCVEHLHFSEDAACKRIRAARLARQFPAVFPLLAAGGST